VGRIHDRMSIGVVVVLSNHTLNGDARCRQAVSRPQPQKQGAAARDY
jgi:hypothetical protein